MCLAIPAKIIEMNGTDELLKPAIAEFGGIRKPIYLSLTPEANVGDYVLVHVGFAISILDETKAKALLDELSGEF